MSPIEQCLADAQQIRRSVWEITEAWELAPVLLLCSSSLRWAVREADMDIPYMVCGAQGTDAQQEYWRELGIRNVVPRLIGPTFGIVMRLDERDTFFFCIKSLPRG
jgi:hypothetical protein